MCVDIIFINLTLAYQKVCTLCFVCVCVWKCTSWKGGGGYSLKIGSRFVSCLALHFRLALKGSLVFLLWFYGTHFMYIFQHFKSQISNWPLFYYEFCWKSIACF